MSKRYHIIKEVTCPDCDGLGFREDCDGRLPVYDLDTLKEMLLGATGEEREYLEEQIKYYYEDHFCTSCQGKGYIVDAIDLETGFRIIEGEY